MATPVVELKYASLSELAKVTDFEKNRILTGGECPPLKTEKMKMPSFLISEESCPDNSQQKEIKKS
jgi:hypothetical protein